MNTSPDWKSVVLLFAHIFTSLTELYLSVVLLRTLGGSGYSVPQWRLLILGKREITVKQQIINLKPVHFRYFNILLFKKKKKKVFKNDENTSKYMYVRGGRIIKQDSQMKLYFIYFFFLDCFALGNLFWKSVCWVNQLTSSILSPATLLGDFFPHQVWQRNLLWRNSCSCPVKIGLRQVSL